MTLTLTTTPNLYPNDLNRNYPNVNQGADGDLREGDNVRLRSERGVAGSWRGLV